MIATNHNNSNTIMQIKKQKLKNKNFIKNVSSKQQTKATKKK